MRYGIAALGLLALAGCRKENPPAATVEPKTFVINATDMAFQLPDTVEAGVVRILLANAGPSLHHAQLMRITDGRNFDSVMAALRQPGPPPRWVQFVGSPNSPAPGDTSEIVTTLEPGPYAVICMIPDSAGRPHAALGMVKPLMVVAASGASAPEPAADVEIRMNDYSFVESGPITAGRRTIKLINDGPQIHEMFLARLDSGVTPQQLVAWTRSGMKGRPPALPMGGIVAVDKDKHVFMVADFAPGNYGLFCFFPAPDGREHVDHGMLKQITVN